MEEQPQEHQRPTGWKVTLAWAWIIYALLLLYAIFRYNVFMGVYWEDLPLYVNNKVIADSAVVFIAISVILGPVSIWWPRLAPKVYLLRKTFGLLGFGMAGVHSFISLLLFGPMFYPTFFDSVGKLNLIGELSMLFGVLGLFIFALVAISSLPSVQNALHFEKWKRVQRLGYLAFVFVMLHVVGIGLEEWLRPHTWPGGLLPTTFIAFIVILFAFLVRIISIFVKR